MTTGSFYRHFSSWQDFRTRLLQEWHARGTASLVEIADANHDPWERVRLLREQLLEFPSRTEAAIRAWGAADAEVAEAQRGVDDQRIKLSTAAMAEIVGPDDARHFAMTGMHLLIGWESLGRGEPETLDWALRRLLRDAAELAVQRGGPQPPADVVGTLARQLIPTEGTR